MSDTDGFIDEVSEEVRRDRLFKQMRKWGWIPILLVVTLVGGAAYNEWSKARADAKAQTLGTAILSAIQLEDPSARAAAFDQIEAQGDRGAVLALVAAGDYTQDGNTERAISTLRAVAQDTALSSTYRHLAELKLLLILGNDIPTADKMARLQAIAVPGAPYRLLAEEQMALAEVSSGDTKAATQRLMDIIADGEVTAGLRRRVSQLIVALGGELAPS
ncbi:MAG: hypothetical protein V3V25_05550 [Paracoccaceae bacterium]